MTLAHQTIITALILLPLAVAITYIDVRYRRIPNKLVLATLLVGLTLNTIFGGAHGLMASLGGLALAFGMMFLLHLFGTMGAGDVKLFAAIGAVNGISLVLPTLFVVVLTGGVMAVGKMIYGKRVATTMFGVGQFFYGLLPGQTIPRFAIPSDRRNTLPYAVPICIGGLISLFLFRA